MVDLENVLSVINAPESVAIAQTIADRSVTLVRNEADFVPLNTAASQLPAFLLLTEGPTSVEGQAFATEVKHRAPGAQVITLDSNMSDADLKAALQQVFRRAPLRSGSFRFRSGLPRQRRPGRWLPAVHHGSGRASRKPVALAALGNPYLLRNFPDVSAYLTTYSTVPPSEVATVKALFGEIPIHGKLPVSIPGFAQYGDGIQVAASRSAPASARSSIAVAPH